MLLHAPWKHIAEIKLNQILIQQYGIDLIEAVFDREQKP
jgi:hypothetical protein